jgi:Undecaprenyl-phosphate glucose phosphotransferase
VTPGHALYPKPDLIEPPASFADSGKSGAKSRAMSRATISGLVAASDIVLITASSSIAFFFYVSGVLDSAAGFDHYLLPGLVAAVAMVALLASWRWYRFDEFSRVPLQIGRVTLGLTLVILALLSSAFLTKSSTDWSRGWLLIAYALSLFSLSIGRALLALWIGKLRRNGAFDLKIALIGSQNRVDQAKAALSGTVEQPISIVGCFYIDEEFQKAIDELTSLSRNTPLDQIIIALPWSEETLLSKTIDQLRLTPISIRLTLDSKSLQDRVTMISRLGATPLAHLYERPLSDWQIVLKRGFDLGLGSVLLLLLAPLMLLIALIVKIESPGSVIFRQRRHGLNNSVFTILKFRTMHRDRSDPSGVEQTRPFDPRVTRVGAFLRRFSLDELPQLINVLRGEMSLIGPRAHPIEMRAVDRRYEELVEDYAARHRVKPGMTGWAQVHGWRGPTLTEESARKRIEYDIHYIESWSVWLDLKIILMTFIVLLTGRNSY